MRNWIRAGVAVFGLMATSSMALGTPLAPGDTVPPDGFAELGSFVTSVTNTFSGTTSGTITEAVFALGGGTLDFDYQITITSGQLGRLTVTNYKGFATDVSSTVLITPPFVGPSLGAGASTADRSSLGTDGGDTVGFNWVPKLASPATTFQLVIRTDATTYSSNVMNIIDGTVFTFDNGFGPAAVTPEPRTLLLLAGILPGLGGMAHWRRRQAKTISA